MSLQTKLTFKENKAPIIIEHNNMDEVKARVTLQTLQPSAKVKGLVGKDSVKSTKSTKKVQAVNGKIHVFEDSSNVSQPPKKNVVTMEDKDIQTEDFAVEDQIKSMTTDEISVEYFSVLAERRRVALTEALEENEQLHREIDSLKSENATLKAENSVLKPLAEETEYLAGIVKDLIGNAEDEGGNDGVTETEVDDKEDKATQSES